MADVAEITSRLWQAVKAGAPLPLQIDAELGLADAYDIQTGMLRHHQANGEVLTGWKIGLSSAGVRQRLRVAEPVSSYLLASRHFQSGQSFSSASVGRPMLEAELCFTVGQRLSGERVRPEEVRAGVSAVAAAFEIVDATANPLANLPLSVAADGIGHWGYVTALPVSPALARVLGGDVTAELLCNGARVVRVAGNDALDDHFESIVWLANTLASRGLALEPGQHVITGSFNKPAPAAAGEEWVAVFPGIGRVEVRFAP